MTLHFRFDGFSVLYALIACFAWGCTLLFSVEYFKQDKNKKRYLFFNLLTFVATVGMFLADDLYTAFIFFEVMSFASYPWVIHDQTKAAIRAGNTYLAYSVVGGMVSLMGMFMLYQLAGTLTYDGMLAYATTLTDKTVLYVPGALAFVGFATKAGVFPLHGWLPKAYPVAPAPATALLSSVLTKTGVFGMLVISSNLFLHDPVWGNALLVLGLITMFVGALLALLSADFKLTLACSSMSQIGFIVLGIGMQGLLGEHNAFAVQGTLLHMVNHSLLKLTLFMVAGAIFMSTKKLGLNDIQGYGRKKPLLHVVFLMAYLGIIGFPLFNGYISKSLLHESMVEYVHLLHQQSINPIWYEVAEKAFVIIGGMTIAYMTKLYIAVFWRKNHDEKCQQAYDQNKHYLSKCTAIALVVSAVVLPVLGIFPDIFMTGIATIGQGFMHGHSPAHAVEYFSSANLLGTLQSFLAAVVIYLFAYFFTMKKENKQRVYVNKWPKPVDCSFVMKVITYVIIFVTRLFDSVGDLTVVLFRAIFLKHNHTKPTPPVGTRGTWAVGRLLNTCTDCINLTFRRKNKLDIDFIAILAAWRDEVTAASRRITRSVSFGLLLMCIGLFVTFMFLLNV